MIVDGREVVARGTLLETCRDAGVDVAAFCYDQSVSAGGHCRSCLVEADGRWVAACTTAATGVSQVRVDTPALQRYRLDLGELMLSESTPGGEVGRRLAAWGASGARYGRAGSGPEDASHPYLRLDLSACIKCRLCVRACDEIQGQFVYAFEERGRDAHLAWGGTPFAHSGCVACGACVERCPTGAISDVDRLRAPVAAAPTRTTCGYCGVGCQLLATGDGHDVLRVDAAAAPANRQHLCVKGKYAHGFLRHADRLRTPLIRRDGALVPATWEEAIAAVASGLAALRGRVAALSSSRSTNEENYLLQKWFRAGLGTNDVDCCARVCHAPSAAGMRASLGTGAATNHLADLALADLVLVVGANATEAHPVTGARIKQAALRGAGLVVIDPRRTELARMADVHLQVRPGGNVPLFNALAAVLVEEGLVDRAFVAARVEGWDAYVAGIGAWAPERVEPLTGVPAAAVRVAARRYGRAARPMMVHGLGVTEHYQGGEAVMLLCNLALLVGAIGRPGVGVNPLRGQNNVQGSVDMGVDPASVTGYQPISDVGVRDRVGAIWGRPLPEAPGRRLPEMLDAAVTGEIRGMFVFGEDLVQSDPHSDKVRRALGALELLVVQELFLTQTARLAHVVLPGASWFEKDGTFTSGERRIQRVRQVVEAAGDARADWRILCDLMTASGLPQAFAHPSEIMDEIARVAPLFAGVSYARLDGDGLQWPVPAADHPGTPRLHADAFPGGRARLAVVDFLPSPSLGSGLVLVTGRVLEHYNCGAQTRRTPNLELHSHDALEIHPSDAAPRGIATGDRVRIRSAQGEAQAVARVTEGVLRGTLFLSFHFPDTGTNAVTGDVVDRMTGCPEYKISAVEVERLGADR
jgi:formate dehydrogenase alpha subunit